MIVFVPKKYVLELNTHFRRLYLSVMF